MVPNVSRDNMVINKHIEILLGKIYFTQNIKASGNHPLEYTLVLLQQLVSNEIKINLSIDFKSRIMKN